MFEKKVLTRRFLNKLVTQLNSNGISLARQNAIHRRKRINYTEPVITSFRRFDQLRRHKLRQESLLARNVLQSKQTRQHIVFERAGETT